MTIRKWQETDLTKIAELERLCFSDPWRLEDFRAVLQFPFLYGILLEEEGQVLGYACTQVVCDEMELQNIAVAPFARGRGVGSALLTEAEGNAKTLGATQSFLEVRVSNAGAIALYQKFGYKKIGARKNYYPDGEDALLMKKEW